MSKSKSYSVPSTWPLYRHLKHVSAYAAGPAIYIEFPSLMQTWIVPHCPWCFRPHFFPMEDLVHDTVCTDPIETVVADKLGDRHCINRSGVFNDLYKLNALLYAAALRHPNNPRPSHSLLQGPGAREVQRPAKQQSKGSRVSR
jgi:hypothetical protein